MDREVVKISEIFYRAAQEPISVVMAGRHPSWEDRGKPMPPQKRTVWEYYTTLHACPSDGRSCYEMAGHYDMTWDEAVESFYTRQLKESQGTDQAKFAPQMVCAKLKKELEAYKKYTVEEK